MAGTDVGRAAPSPPVDEDRSAMMVVADWCIRHARVVVAGWVVAAVGLLLAGSLLGAHYRTVFRLPGSDAQRAVDLTRAAFPDQRGETDLLVLHAASGSFTDTLLRARAERLVARLRTVPDVWQVSSPFADSGPQARLSPDRRTAVTDVRFRQPTDEIPTRSVRRVIALVAGARDRLLDTGLSGQAVENVESNQPGAAEGVALLAAVVVLLVGFGSAAAVGIALASAGLALGVGFGAMSLASHLVAIPTFASQIATTIGLGVGIDYALLVLARYRSASHAGLDPPAATVTAMRGAGRAVLFAGATVMLALLGLFLVGLPFVHGMALGVVLVVAPTALAATTVLPAILGHAGRQLDRWRPPGMRGRQLTGRSTGWARWAVRVQRRPVTAICGSLVLLGLLAAPVVSMRLGSAEASTDNRDTASHRAYQYTAAAFGPGYTRPFQLVATLPTERPGNEHQAVSAVRRVLRHTPGIDAVSVPELDPSRRHALFTVYSATVPTARQTDELLHRLRGPIRGELARHRVRLAVGGPAAIGFDLADTIRSALPIVLTAVIGTSLLLLLVLFRSVVVALKAGLMNLLAIAAAFGVVVAVIQHGWALHAIGVDYPGPIEVFLPLLLFPTVFGLSMDYEVFLLSRIRDEWDRSHDNSRAVREGLATTGRVVTAGAAIMIVLFASLVFADARTVKVFGLGLAVAILLDAIVVRSVLLPATMQLLGRFNWWLPRWLDRRLPRLTTEPATTTEPLAGLSVMT